MKGRIPIDFVSHWKHCVDISIYVTGMLCDLRDDGILQGEFDLTEKGRARLTVLLQEGFEPTHEELYSYLSMVALSMVRFN